MTSALGKIFKSSRIRTINRSYRLLHLLCYSLVGDVKEPISLFEKSSRGFSPVIVVWSEEIKLRFGLRMPFNDGNSMIFSLLPKYPAQSTQPNYPA